MLFNHTSLTYNECEEFTNQMFYQAVKYIEFVLNRNYSRIEIIEIKPTNNFLWKRGYSKMNKRIRNPNSAFHDPENMHLIDNL